MSGCLVEGEGGVSSEWHLMMETGGFDRDEEEWDEWEGPCSSRDATRTGESRARPPDVRGGEDRGATQGVFLGRGGADGGARERRGARRPGEDDSISSTATAGSFRAVTAARRAGNPRRRAGIEASRGRWTTCFTARVSPRGGCCCRRRRCLEGDCRRRSTRPITSASSPTSRCDARQSLILVGAECVCVKIARGSPLAAIV